MTTWLASLARIARRIADIAAGGVALLAMVLAACLLAFDVHDYEPHRAEIQALIAATTPQERTLPPGLEALMRAAHPHGRLALAATRIVLWRVRDDAGMPLEIRSSITWLAWQALVTLHLSMREQLALVAGYSFMGHGRSGYEAESQARYGRPLSALTRQESATLVVLPRSPSHDEIDPAALAVQRDRLLGQVDASPGAAAASKRQ